LKGIRKFTMDTKEKLTQALHEAMKSGNIVVKNTTRIVISSIKLAEIDKGKSLDEQSILSIIQKEIKSRQEVIEEAKKGNRNDIIESNQQEMDVLKTFLPEQLSEENIGEMAKETIKELNATGITDMGKVMKSLLPKIQGKASNDLVSKVVRNLLLQ
jgi:uncharacterized protein